MIRILGGTAALLLLTACDNFVSYTVTDYTSEPLQSWVLFEECEDVTGNDGEYDYERHVSPGETVRVSDARGTLPGAPWCVQVVDFERRLVAAEPYPEHASRVDVVVSEPLTRGQVIPPEEQLPGRTWGEKLSENPSAYVFMVFGMLIGAGTLVAIAYGFYETVKSVGRKNKIKP